jgi:hypothetical protein
LAKVASQQELLGCEVKDRRSAQDERESVDDDDDDDDDDLEHEEKDEEEQAADEGEWSFGRRMGEGGGGGGTAEAKLAVGARAATKFRSVVAQQLANPELKPGRRPAPMVLSFHHLRLSVPRAAGRGGGAGCGDGCRTDDDNDDDDDDVHSQHAGPAEVRDSTVAFLRVFSVSATVLPLAPLFVALLLWLHG